MHEFENGEHVQVLRDLAGIRAGDEGIVIGNRPDPSGMAYVVRFGPVLRPVQADDLGPAAAS